MSMGILQAATMHKGAVKCCGGGDGKGDGGKPGGHHQGAAGNARAA